ncbi:MAG: dTDP-4-dehydrorhamnose reductase [Longimicrobiales bacterium]
MKIAVTGATGMLARAVMAAAHDREHDVIALDRAALDITDRARVRDVIAQNSPDVIIHCAAYTRVDDAEDEADAAECVNGEATGHVAEAAAAAGALFVYPSSDYVFDGSAARPYRPHDETAPLGAYGRSKLLGEVAAARAGRYHVVRTSWLYGLGGRNFVSTMLQRGRARQPLRVVADQVGTPTWTHDLSTMILSLAERAAPSGIYHATNAGHTTWFDFARAIFELAEIDANVQPVASSGYPQKAQRPQYSVLDCSATYAITGDAPHWRDGLRTALRELA